MFLTTIIYNPVGGRPDSMVSQKDFDNIPRGSILLGILYLIGILALGKENQASKRGRPYVFSKRTMLCCYVVMLWKRRGSVRSLHWFLSQDLDDSIEIRKACGIDKVPDRRTFDRRFKALPLEDVVAAIGRCFITYKFIDAAVVAIDSMIMKAWRYLVHHKKDKEAGKKPRPGIDTDAEWTKKHGNYLYGYKCHQVTSTGSTPVPLAATTTPANVADNKVALKLFVQLPLQVIMAILGDYAYHDSNLFLKVKEMTSKANGGLGGYLLTWAKEIPKWRGKGGKGSGPATKAEKARQAMAESDERYLTGGGAKVYMQRSTSVEPEQGRIKAIFGLDSLPVRGERAVNQHVVGCIFAYQLAIFYGFATGRDNPMEVKYLINS